MKIGYVLDDTLDVSDGVQQAMIGIAEKMRERGHEVHYIVPHTARKDLENVHSVGRFWSIKFNGNTVRTPLPLSSKKAKKLIEDIEFDVLHVQMPYSPFFAGKFIKNAPSKTKIFGTFHILPYNSISRLSTKALSLSLRRTNKRINKSYAVSEPARKFMESHFGLDGEVLPNPVDYSFFNTSKPFKADKITVVYIGRFDERKGVKNLVEAYELLDKNTKNKILLTMCGKGPLLKEISYKVNEEKLNINLPGFVTEEYKASLLSGSDIAIFPSISGESFGIVLTEAMAAGAGITLGGNNPGYASVLYKWPECLFNPRNPEDIASVLLKFINDKKLRLKIGAQQHKYVKQFDLNLIVDKLESDYYS